MSGEEHILEKFRRLLLALKKTALSILSVCLLKPIFSFILLRRIKIESKARGQRRGGSLSWLFEV
jgi:hypothetical protein